MAMWVADWFQSPQKHITHWRTTSQQVPKVPLSPASVQLGNGLKTSIWESSYTKYVWAHLTSEHCVRNRTHLQPETESHSPSRAFIALPPLPTESSENISIYANYLTIERFYSLPLEVVILIDAIHWIYKICPFGSALLSERSLCHTSQLQQAFMRTFWKGSSMTLGLEWLRIVL